MTTIQEEFVATTESEVIQLKNRILETRRMIEIEKMEHEKSKKKNAELNSQLAQSEKQVNAMKTIQETIKSIAKEKKEKISGILAEEELKAKKLIEENDQHKATFNQVKHNYKHLKKVNDVKEQKIEELKAELEKLEKKDRKKKREEIQAYREQKKYIHQYTWPGYQGPFY